MTNDFWYKFLSTMCANLTFELTFPHSYVVVATVLSCNGGAPWRPFFLSLL